MPKLANRISFSKDHVNAEPDFYKACTLGKWYMVYCKKSSIDITAEYKVRLYVNLIGRRNTLLGIGS